MSRLEELITEHCPNGVEYKNLSQVLTIKNGKDYKTFGMGDVPVYGTGGIMTYIDQAVYNKPSVLIPRKGSIEKLYYVDVPFWTVDTIFYTDIRTEVIEPKFVFYYLQTQHLEKLNTAGGVPSLTQAVLNTVKIPLPPLPVQNEIVRILNKFTDLEVELEVELEAELEARKQQYEYYRYRLLRPNVETQNYKLIDFAEYSKDRINASDVNKDNYVGVDNLLQNKMGKTQSNYVPTSGKLARYEAEDILIGNIRPYLKKIWFASSFGGTNGDVLVIRLKPEFEGSVLPRYLFHILSSDDFFNYNTQNSKGAKMPRGSKDAIMNYSISIPSMDEQKRIVSILDRFDTLVNDITIGIPAEIEARRKQYEYYRNKLLTFKEVDS